VCIAPHEEQLSFSTVSAQRPTQELDLRGHATAGRQSRLLAKALPGEAIHAAYHCAGGHAKPGSSSQSAQIGSTSSGYQAWYTRSPQCVTRLLDHVPNHRKLCCGLLRRGPKNNFHAGLWPREKISYRWPPEAGAQDGAVPR